MSNFSFFSITFCIFFEWIYFVLNWTILSFEKKHFRLRISNKKPPIFFDTNSHKALILILNIIFKQKMTSINSNNRNSIRSKYNNNIKIRIINKCYNISTFLYFINILKLLIFNLFIIINNINIRIWTTNITVIVNIVYFLLILIFLLYSIFAIYT